MKRLNKSSGMDESSIIEKAVWKNKSNEIIKEYKCKIPRNIHSLVKAANEIFPIYEFSFFLKAIVEHEKRRILIVEDEWFFPKQKIKTASIDYLEDNTDYNCVLHKHPGSLAKFSSTDSQWINQNFEVSILWSENHGFCDGVVNIPTIGGRVQLPISFTVEEEYLSIDAVAEHLRRLYPDGKVKMPLYLNVKTEVTDEFKNHLKSKAIVPPETKTDKDILALRNIMGSSRDSNCSTSDIDDIEVKFYGNKSLNRKNFLYYDDAGDDIDNDMNVFYY